MEDDTRKILITVLLALFLLSSCTTTVDVVYTRPSDVDMTDYASLAIAPAIPYAGFRVDDGWVRFVRDSSLLTLRPVFSVPDLSRDIARYAEEQVTGILSSSGYYDILPPGDTAGLNLDELSAKGYKALLVPEVTVMELEGKVRNRSRTEYDGTSAKTVWDSYLVETARLELTIRVLDTATGEEVAVRSFSDSVTKEFYLDPSSPEFDSMETYFRRMVRSFNNGVRRMLVPERLTYEAKVMANKPELDRAEPAYKALSGGDDLTALALFQECWLDDGHIPSGYNAALLLAKHGDVSQALDILNDMIDVSEDAKALYQDLSAIF